MLRRTRRPNTDTVRFCDACSKVSTAAERAERHYTDNRHHMLAALSTLSTLR